MIRGCRTRKVRFGRIQAESIAVRSGKYRAYKCEFCRAYHLTTQAKPYKV